MNLKPVVTSLFLMGLACGSAMAEGHDGDDLMTSADSVDVVDATVDVSDVDESRRRCRDWSGFPSSDTVW